jgi:hypothetical protein
MTALTPAEAALTVGQRIGRYFALISMIPSLFLVLWVYLLIASGSLSGTPALRHVEKALSQWSFGKVAEVVLATLVVAVVLHPLQFVTTQFLEGYWGTTPLAIGAMKTRIVHHRKRQRELVEQEGANQIEWREAAKALIYNDLGTDAKGHPNLERRIDAKMKSELADPLMLHVIAEQEAGSRRERNYPPDAKRVLPTQLGNALRRFEDTAGDQYGLRTLALGPHLHLVAPPRHLEYLVDAREDMDSAIRICTFGLVAMVLTVGLLLTDGLWLLWALLPYTVSYLAYRGAVSAAQGYGDVVAAVIDLDRFLLYDQLGLYQPRDNTEEKKNNEELMHFLAGREANVRYRTMSATTERPPRYTRRGGGAVN